MPGLDITYSPVSRGFIYLAAVVDWFIRRVLSLRLSIMLKAGFCIKAVKEALARQEIEIRMDSKGAGRNNVFVKRLWRIIKHEEVYFNLPMPEAVTA
jgi:putative transposase